MDKDGLILCDIQAKAFELSHDYTNCSSPIFIRRYMKSEIVRMLDNRGILQTTLYEKDLLERIEEEYGISNYGQIKYEKDALYWIGYIYRYYCYTFNRTSRQAYKIIKPDELYKVYLPYHTLSPAQAIERILESKNIDINETELERQYKVLKRIYLEDMEKHKHI